MAVDEGAVLRSFIEFGPQRRLCRDFPPKPEFSYDLVGFEMLECEDSRFSELGLPDGNLGHLETSGGRAQLGRTGNRRSLSYPRLMTEGYQTSIETRCAT